jgi:hypothetical protein
VYAYGLHLLRLPGPRKFGFELGVERIPQPAEFLFVGHNRQRGGAEVIGIAKDGRLDALLERAMLWW